MTTPPEGPPLGTRMGRYVVLSTIGMGSMGVVVAAYDPELDRKAALKLMRARGTRSGSHRARLAREAQALAKLNHPNVVTIYDVGEHEGQVFVAMEFVNGTTLAEWLTTPRSHQAILRVFLAAGEGLAAAHAAGLVHRDFKPDNVMVDAHERVRVMDFGLARAFDPLSSEEPSEDIAAPLEALAMLASSSQRSRASPSPLATPLTRTGALLGTPAYMAPEQWMRLGTSPHTDQFAFCVALYEALYAQRPFVGEELDTLARAVLRGELVVPPRGKLPGHVRRALLRGLARNPVDRHASMRDLLTALADDPRARWRRRGIALLIGGLSLAAAWGAWRASERDDAAPTCAGGRARLAGVWDDARRAEVDAAIVGTGLVHAHETATRVEQRLDLYATAWVAAHRDACEAHQRGEQSGELLDLRMRCLDERLRHVAAMVEVLRRPSDEVVSAAVEAVAALPSLEQCSDEQALTDEVPPPSNPALAERVATLDEQLIAAQALRRAGEFERGRTLAKAVIEDAATLDYVPLRARAWLLAGELAELAGDYAEAETLLEQAYGAALGLGMRDEAAEAAAMLIGVVGDRRSRYDAGHAWAKSAEPLARALGRPEADALVLEKQGVLALSEGEYERARGYLERALAIRERTLGSDHPSVADLCLLLGVVALKVGDTERARPLYERALAIREQVLGPQHPAVAYALDGLGMIARDNRRYDEARAYLQRAAAIRERTLASTHPHASTSIMNLGFLEIAAGNHSSARPYFARALVMKEQVNDELGVAVVLFGLGEVANAEGDYPLALAHFERVVAIREKVLGPNHPEVAYALNNLGNHARRAGDHERARAALERCLAIWSEVVGPEHAHVATALNNLGEVAQAEGDCERARMHHERALAIREKALSPEHPHLAYSLTGLGEALLCLDAPADALPYLERAATIRDAGESDPVLVADTRFALARALRRAPASAGRDPARARELAERAATLYEAAGPKATRELERVRAWLD